MTPTPIELDIWLSLPEEARRSIVHRRPSLFNAMDLSMTKALDRWWHRAEAEGRLSLAESMTLLVPDAVDETIEVALHWFPRDVWRARTGWSIARVQNHPRHRPTCNASLSIRGNGPAGPISVHLEAVGTRPREAVFRLLVAMWTHPLRRDVNAILNPS